MSGVKGYHMQVQIRPKYDVTGGLTREVQAFVLLQDGSLSFKNHKINSGKDKNMYKKFQLTLDFVSREKEVEKFWDDNEIFQKSMDEKEGCPDYIFYDESSDSKW